MPPVYKSHIVRDVKQQVLIAVLEPDETLQKPPLLPVLAFVPLELFIFTFDRTDFNLNNSVTFDGQAVCIGAKVMAYLYGAFSTCVRHCLLLVVLYTGIMAPPDEED